MKAQRSEKESGHNEKGEMVAQVMRDCLDENRLAEQDEKDWRGNQLADEDGLEAGLEEPGAEPDPSLLGVGCAA
eukprot:4233286-Alexandrium_andersonii.AAC.1